MAWGGCLADTELAKHTSFDVFELYQARQHLQALKRYKLLIQFPQPKQSTCRLLASRRYTEEEQETHYTTRLHDSLTNFRI
jgi:hypothetical protein